MYQASAFDSSTLSKSELYEDVRLHLKGLFTGESNMIANAANFSALLFDRLPDLNWAGFYFLDEAGSELVVGPFQGKPACVRIAVGRGVCGTSVATGQSIVVPDVREFPGHIACDAASRSELVVPLRRGDTVIGVLDLDSPTPNRFDDIDRVHIEQLAADFVQSFAA
ncbi:GAF domain-containing protein [Devosia sp. 2618]|uniref:GAF domain-containing protein n=1 Tax=Devosia sp. 2618 TaxID=3156454 RepID=UPI003394813E